MRILFATIPAFTHTAAMVPLAQAAQMAGHEVLFAGGDLTRKVAVEAGLAAVDPAPGQDVAAPYRRCMEIVGRGDLQGQEEVGKVFIGANAEMAEMMMAGLVQTCRDWGADIVVYPPVFPWAQLAARTAGALSVVHGIGLRFPVVPWFAKEPSAVVQEHGVTEFPAHPDAEVDLGIASLEKFNPLPQGEISFPKFTQRPCSYNGSGEVPRWALRRPDRPRIAVTMGNTSDEAGWPELLRAIVNGSADLDVELVLTSGGVDLATIVGELPEYARVVDFVPLSALLSHCDALLHHSGMGTAYAALAAGVPQVLLPPNAGDAPITAHMVTSRGCGVAVDRQAVTAETIGKALREVLDVPSYQTASREVAAEMAAMSAPHEIVDRLVELAAERAR